MKKTVQASIGLAIALLIVGPVVGLKVFQIGNLIAYAGEMQAAGMPPAAVATAPVETQSWGNTLLAVGSLEPVQGVTLAAELGGKVSSIHVENGAAVSAGDVLVRLDTAAEEASLASAQASLRLARINLDRARDLLAQNTISQSEFDAADATHAQALASVANLQSIIDRKSVRAPFAGRVGIRTVNLGQIVREGDSVIPLQALDPIYVSFSVPQRSVQQLSVGRTVTVSLTGMDSPVQGLVTAINPQLDPVTRNVRVQGTLANPDESLRPGMFANVSLSLPGEDEVVVIPLTSVLHAAYGDSVFVVEEKDGATYARQQFVRLGRARGDFVAVLDGVRPGQRVVSAGAHKLLNNQPVVIEGRPTVEKAAVAPNDAMQPPASVTPTPANS
jgi:membrane fusion protein (multidrug efflux system)